MNEDLCTIKFLDIFFNQPKISWQTITSIELIYNLHSQVSVCLKHQPILTSSFHNDITVTLAFVIWLAAPLCPRLRRSQESCWVGRSEVSKPNSEFATSPCHIHIKICIFFAINLLFQALILPVCQKPKPVQVGSWKPKRRNWQANRKKNKKLTFEKNGSPKVFTIRLSYKIASHWWQWCWKIMSSHPFFRWYFHYFFHHHHWNWFQNSYHWIG